MKRKQWTAERNRTNDSYLHSASIWMVSTNFKHGPRNSSSATTDQHGKCLQSAHWISEIVHRWAQLGCFGLDFWLTSSDDVTVIYYCVCVRIILVAETLTPVLSFPWTVLATKGTGEQPWINIIREWPTSDWICYSRCIYVPISQIKHFFQRIPLIGQSEWKVSQWSNCICGSFRYMYLSQILITWLHSNYKGVLIDRTDWPQNYIHSLTTKWITTFNSTLGCLVKLQQGNTLHKL